MIYKSFELKKIPENTIFYLLYGKNEGLKSECINEILKKNDCKIFNYDEIQIKDKIESEFGDVLFALTNYARFINVNPEDALERTNKRFIQRFQIMEKLIKEDKLDLAEMNLKEMDVYWDKAKIIYLSLAKNK